MCVKLCKLVTAFPMVLGMGRVEPSKSSSASYAQPPSGGFSHLARQPVEAQRLAAVLLDPVGQLGMLLRPALEPGREVALGLGQVAPIIEPAQLDQAVVVGLARQMVARVPHEMHVSPLPDRLRQNLADRPLEALMVVGDHELHPRQPALAQARQEVLPTARTLTIGHLYRQNLAPAS